MGKNIKVLIVPDVHGRDFWREPVEEVLKDDNARIIFLGDYTDPYPYEWEDVMDGDSRIDYHKKVVTDLTELIELKKANPNKITLLLGNHDCSYAVGTNVCDCRRDRFNASKITELFRNNRELFQLADEETINGEHFIFSHAGIGKTYAEACFGDEVNEDNVVSLFNDAWFTDKYGIMDSLGIYDYFRGWGGQNYASLVWADVREWGDSEGSQVGYGHLIFGHTQLAEKPYIGEKFACLDCRRCFYLDDSGVIRDYETDEVSEINKDNKKGED